MLFSYKGIGLNRIMILIFAAMLLSSVNPSCKKHDPETGAGTSIVKDKTIPDVGSIAPDFILKDIQGKDVRLSEYRGKIVLLEFWATWCPPCRVSVPDLVGIQEKYRNKEFVILGISIDEGGDITAKLNEFIKEYKINYAILIGDENVSNAYNVRGIPVTFLIDREGKIANYYNGYNENFAKLISREIDKIK